MSETKRLGRGLEALLGSVSREQAQASGALRELPVGNVLPNPFQPRTHIDENELGELTASIEASGLLQPVIVRPRNGAVRVDGDAGEVTVHDFVVVQDAGRAINPIGVEGQMQGGAVQSLGIALTEQLMFDDNGRLMVAMSFNSG